MCVCVCVCWDPLCPPPPFPPPMWTVWSKCEFIMWERGGERGGERGEWGRCKSRVTSTDIAFLGTKFREGEGEGERERERERERVARG